MKSSALTTEIDLPSTESTGEAARPQVPVYSGETSSPGERSAAALENAAGGESKWNVDDMKRIAFSLLLLALMIAVTAVGAEPGAAGEAGHDGGHLSISSFLFAIVLVLLAAKVGGEIFERVNQPAVLGELVFGMVLGNLHLVGIHSLDWFKSSEGLAVAAEIGVILLLFEVGLESNIDELLAVGASAMLVACLGVVAPMVLGYGVSVWFLPEAAWYVHLFAGATLAATSVGITARVLKDLRQMETKEARIILGAAVVDDVLGLIILAVVSGLISSISHGGGAEISLMPVLIIIAKSVAFLAGAVLLGRALAGKILHFGAGAKVAGLPVVLSVCYCFVLAGLAEVVGLAPIVGAFAAGLVLDEAHYERYHSMKTVKFEELISPISSVLVPVFFVLMGFRVDLASFGQWHVLEFAAGLSIAAIIGKQICSLGILEKGLNRIAVGVGMIPRGEVGLIFAGMGSTLMVAGKPVFGADTFSSMVVMVMVTTVATPPLLKLVFARQKKTPANAQSNVAA